MCEKHARQLKKNEKIENKQKIDNISGKSKKWKIRNNRDNQ